jgi:histidinol-phosphate aminotransferase
MSAPLPYMPEIDKAVVKKTAVAGRRPVLDLSLNESSHGASPLAVAAATSRCQRLMRYPDPASTTLRQAIGRRFGLPPDDLVCGNGSEELLDIIGRLYARPGDEILFTDHGFLQFPIVAQRVGATPVRAAERDLTADIDALLAAVTPRTRILFIANPNNPTGTHVGADDLRRLRDGLPGRVVLVIDSAYAEYVDAPGYSAGHELVAGSDNVVVTRTFSKAFGLAALRVGWAHCPPAMSGVLNRMRGIGNVNAIAQEAAVAALDDMDFVARVRDETGRERTRVTAALAGLGLDVVPSGTNFVIARFPPGSNRGGAAAIAHLAARDIVVRGIEDYGLADHLRITIGLAAENDRLIEGLASLHP